MYEEAIWKLPHSMDPNGEDLAGLSLLKQRLNEDHDRLLRTSADDFEILVAGPDTEGTVHIEVF